MAATQYRQHRILRGDILDLPKLEPPEPSIMSKAWA